MSTQALFHATKRVILDKSFLQAETQSGDRLRLLRDCGATFVLTDTLIYELCTDTRTTQWPATQRKLFPFADSIEVWWHVSDLLKQEIVRQRPVESPVDRETTERVRQWFRGGEVYVPPNLVELGKVAHQEREKDSVDSLIESCQEFCRISPEYTQKIQHGGPEAKALLRDLMSCEELVKWRVRNDHGKSADTELYIQGAENGLGAEWFAYQHAKSSWALCCHFMSKYGLNNQSGRDFIHTKLDSDYVVLLHFADALATNETSGSLASICEWMHGKSKVVFSTSKLDAACPRDESIRLESYYKWEREGRTHGHDQEDWFSAKCQLLWKLLNPKS